MTRRAPTAARTLTDEQRAEANPIERRPLELCRGDLPELAERPDSRPDAELLGAAECEVRDRVHRLGARAVEVALEGRGRGSYRGSSMSCPACQGPAKFVAYRGPSVVGRLGPVRLRRAYYHCPGCHAGSAPADSDLRLSSGSLTPSARGRLPGRGAVRLRRGGRDDPAEARRPAPRRVDRRARRRGGRP